MRKLIFAGTLLICAGVVACTSSQLATATETGMILAGKDPDKARRVGASVGQFAGGMSKEISLDDEVALGRGISLKLLEMKGGLHADNELQRYVNMVGHAVAERSDRPNLKYIFGVVNDEEVNAWAAPGGYVFITVGTLRELESEAELAGVLAHEVAHVQEGHMVRVLKKMQVQTGISDALKATDSDYEEYGQSLESGLRVLVENGLPWEMEYEADTLGSEIATLTGYKAEGLRDFLGKIETPDDDDAEGGWLSHTHPPVSKRIESLGYHLDGKLAGFDGASQEERFAKYVTNRLAKK